MNRGAHVTASGTWHSDLNRLVLDDPDGFHKKVRALKLAAGEAVTVRVEREAEAWRHSDLKHLFGHVYGPVVDWTGYSKLELHGMSKSLWMPEGKSSLTELNREELREYTEHVERWLREEIPEAFAVSEPAGYVN